MNVHKSKVIPHKGRECPDPNQNLWQLSKWHFGDCMRVSCVAFVGVAFVGVAGGQVVGRGGIRLHLWLKEPQNYPRLKDVTIKSLGF